MSKNVSNLYATRVFAENPIALWSADDDLRYVSLLSASAKQGYEWSFINSSLIPDVQATSLVTQSRSIPLPNDPIFGMQSNILTSASTSSRFIFDSGINTANLDIDKSTLTIFTNVLRTSTFVNGYVIGFLNNSGSVISSASFPREETPQLWQQISNTISYPENEIIKPFIQVNFITGGSSSTQYVAYFNGTSLGQWSEPFVETSTGSILNSASVPFYDLLPSASTTLKYFTLDSYGITQENDGYYLLENERMLAENSGLPMVFGASSVTKLFKPITENMPSIVCPGKGFLNENGQYKQLTAEFWLKIYNTSQTPLKIFGPLSGQDGLYVEEEFLTVRVGKYSKSYFIGKWYRPMLIDFVYTPTYISLLINGIEVITIQIDVEQINFPESTKDWLGFFAHEKTQPFEIDAIGIYPYTVSDQLAKRRFVYGQGVEYPDIVAGNFNAENIFADYAFAKYTGDVEYPRTVKWGSGFLSNLTADSQRLLFPEYIKPELQILGPSASAFISDQRDFYEENYLAQSASTNLFFSMKPESASVSYANIDPTLFFDKLDVISPNANSFFGVFYSDENNAEEQVLIQIKNKISGNTFRISKTGYSIDYIFNNGSDIGLTSKTASGYFTAGIKIDSITTNYQTIITDFFANPQNLTMNVGGTEGKTFTGKIFSFTFNNRLFTNKDLTSYIDSNGFFNSQISENDSIINYVGNYSLLPYKTNETVDIEIGCSGYWEGYVPLSILGKMVMSQGGQQYLDLDLIQFNIDFPGPLAVNESPTAEQGEARLKSYVTLQDYRLVGSVPYTSYTQTASVPYNRVIDFDNTSDVLQTKYEVIDGSVIFPPKEGVDYKNYHLGIHIEMSTRSISRKSIKLQRMSVASLAFDETRFYSVGTKTGREVFPFARDEVTYAFKTKNPFLIYKDSTTYMYNTADSGFIVLDYEPSNQLGFTRGLTIPINQTKSASVNFASLEFWSFYKEGYDITETKKIARIDAGEVKIDFNLVPNPDNKSAVLKLINAITGTEIEPRNLVFYQNGNKVPQVLIKPMEWNEITITFGNVDPRLVIGESQQAGIFLNNISGQFEMYQDVLFNNIIFFEKSSEVLAAVSVPFLWITISEQTWGQYSAGGSWLDVAQQFVKAPVIERGKDVFNAYFGLSKIVLSDSSQLEIDYERVQGFFNIDWIENEKFSGKPI